MKVIVDDKHNRVRNAIWNAVQEAQDIGMDVPEFRALCREAWMEAVEDAKRVAAKEWER